MNQIFYIGGGEAKENFAGDYYDFLSAQTYDPYAEKFVNWKQVILREGESFGIEIPFPDEYFADYQAWKIVFQTFLEFVRPGDIFIAASLGGSFLFKYLQEEKTLPVKLSKIILLAPAWQDAPDEVLGGFLPDMNQVPDPNQLANEVHLLHSQDDPVVPYADSQELHEKYLPGAKFHTFKNYGHFYQLPEFPELKELLKS